jgi:hypothetical protein
MSIYSHLLSRTNFVESVVCMCFIFLAGHLMRKDVSKANTLRKVADNQMHAKVTKSTTLHFADL